MTHHAPGQPITPDHNPLAPANGYMNGSGKKAQRDRYEALAPGMRQLMAVVDRQDGNAAHAFLDVLLRERHRASVRIADMHILDAGVWHRTAQELEKHDIHSVRDLAACNPLKLCRDLNILDVLKASLAALRRAVELDAG